MFKSEKDKRHEGATRESRRKGLMSGGFLKRLSGALMALVSLLLLSCSAQPKAEAFAFVTSLSGGTVEVIAASDHKAVAGVWVGTGPCEVAVTPDGSYLYVAHSGSEVSVLRTTDWSSVGSIAGISPAGIAISPDGAFAYVADRASKSITVIEISNNAVIASVPIGKVPEAIAVTPDGAQAYVTLFHDNSVSIISTSDNAVVATVPVGRGPSGVTIAPDGTFAYVSNHPGNSVSVIRTSDRQVVATVPGGGSPSIAITPDGEFVYAPSWNDNNVSVIRTSDNTVVTTIPVGIYPNGVAITPDGAYIYVTNHGSDTVSVIRAADNTVVTSINVARPCRVTIGLAQVSAATVPATVTPVPAELAEQLDALHMTMFLIQVDAELLGEAALRVQSGALDKAGLDGVFTAIARYAVTIDQVASGVPVPEGLSPAWDEAFEAHMETRAILSRWSNAEIDPEQVIAQVEPVRQSAAHAVQVAELWMMQLVGGDTAGLAAARAQQLARMVDQVFAPTPTPSPVSTP